MLAQNRSVRVLVVDDEAVIAHSLVLILRRRGFHAQGVYSGKHAVETAHLFVPDVVVTDFVMQEMDGVETAHRILEILPDCKIILFSGDVETAEKAMARRASRFKILEKPVQPEVLMACLAQFYC